MLAVSKARLIALSTPWGKRGWFHREWTEGQGWERHTVTADQMPRIDPDFLASERIAMGDILWRQEFFCEFLETTESLYRAEDIAAAGASKEKGYSDFDEFIAAYAKGKQ